MKHLLILLLALFSTTAFAAEPAMNPNGLWLTKKGDVAVAIKSCASGTVCGTIHWLRADVTQTDPDGKPLCGQQVLYGFTPAAEPDSWDHGTVFVADEGKSYSAQLHLTAPDRLELRAYLGTPLVGKTKVLRRVDATAYPACTRAAK